MTFEEMQTILAGILASQAKTEVSQAKNDEFQVAFRENMELMRQDLFNTQAIANSNARAIKAAANQQAYDRELQAQRYNQSQAQLGELARIVGQFAESTTQRLTALENKQ